jgi:RNA polymerase sigma-70 factor (ECF subfamily)
MDTTGFDRVFILYYPIAHATALRVLRSDCEAHDVAQFVFYKLWSRKHVLEERALQKWIRVSTRNAAIDCLRKSRREADYFESRDAAIGSEQSAEHDALVNLERAAVGSALDLLHADVRDLLCESFVDDLSHGAIAMRRDVPLGTIKTRIRTGLRQLRRLMEAC